MTTTKTAPNVLIAGSPAEHQNYAGALAHANIPFIYPEYITKNHSTVLSALCTYNFQLLLLPGGGDISPFLYENPVVENSAAPSSPDYVTDFMQFQLMQIAFIKKIPVLGICKGMQLINVYFGGSLHTRLATEKLHQSRDKDIWHPVFFSPEFPMHTHIFGADTDLSEKLHAILSGYPRVNSSHHQGIRRLGNDLVCLQYSEDYLPETIAHTKLPIFAVQWHPERIPDFVENSFGELIELLCQNF